MLSGNSWEASEWDRGYEAGRKAGLEEALKGKPASLQNLAFDTGAVAERERIRANILSRVTDLNCCTKRDNCNEFARLIDSYIEEWLDGENND